MCVAAARARLFALQSEVSARPQERNFERKIKYSCRKVLADSRPRVRGRFAKNEEGAASTAVAKLDGELGEDFDFMDAGLIEGVEDEHSGDAPPGSFEHNSGACMHRRRAVAVLPCSVLTPHSAGTSTSGGTGEERQSALASVFQV